LVVSQVSQIWGISYRNPPKLLFFSGSCSITEVIEQLYYKIKAFLGMLSNLKEYLMKKILFTGLIVLIALTGCATSGGSVPNTDVSKAAYVDGSVGVWLVTINNWISNRGVPTPTAMAFIPSMTDSFEAQFFTVKNYGSPSDPGWAMASPAKVWKANNNEYVVLLVPTRANDSGDGSFSWVFDDAKTIGSGEGDNPVWPVRITSNPTTFTLQDFFNLSELK
jgi:hypothetical protein